MATAKKGSSKGKGKGPEDREPKAAASKTPVKESSAKKGPAQKQKAAEPTESPVDIGIPGFKDNIRLAKDADGLFTKAALVALVALGVAAALGMGKNDGFKSFLHSYLTAYMVGLAIGIGSLWWVTLQNLVNAHWSVVVRRVGELYANTLPVLGLLSLPIVIPTVMGSDVLYAWANHATVEADHLLHHKSGYLNPTAFLIRIVIYFGFFTLLGGFFLKSSLNQDKSGKGDIVGKMRVTAGPSMLLLALALTFCAIDLVMSLDAHWFSTIFGVYYFASCVLSVHATLALSLMWLQSKGRLTQSVTTEHYHDLGKMMFAFTIFWAYIGFSQFMLYWYANLPEETAWFKQRFEGDWGTLAWTLLFGHFVIPFFGLLSRHIKRNKKTLAFWAIWVLFMVYLDMYWLVMPTLEGHGGHEGHPESFGVIDILCLVGVLSAVVATAAFRARNVNLIPVKDPRLERSLAFENI